MRLRLVLLFVLLACSDSGTEPGGNIPVVASVTIADVDSLLEVGQTRQLNATARDNGGNTIAAATIAWSTSDQAIASVSASGVVHAVAPGNAYVRASAGGEHDSVNIVVRAGGTLPVQLSGTIRRIDVVIPQGATHFVTGDLELLADRDVRIAGTLKVAPGVSLIVHAPRTLTIDGVIENGAPAGAQAALLANRSHLEPVRLNGSLVNGGGTIQIGTDILIAAAPGSPNERTRFDYTGKIIAGPGDPAPSRSSPGSDGHDIEIGSATAISASPFANKKGFDVIHIRPSAQIMAGDGGHGFNVNSVTHADDRGDYYEGRATRGGPGGDVVLGAGDSLIVQGLLEAGNGGAGGGIGDEETRFFIPDGNLPGRRKARSLLGMTGDGGNAGKVTITAPNRRILQDIPVADGGQRGIARVTGGNGAAPSGDGGDLDIVFGRHGLDGNGQPTEGAFVSVEVFLGLNGGESIDAGSPGGDGGRVRLESADQPASGYLQLRESSRGGPGFNGCIGQPFVPGTGGGNGGDLFLYTSSTQTFGWAIERQFQSAADGGPGGDGTTPGSGGPTGVERGPDTPIGYNGSAGYRCGPMLTITIDDPIDFIYRTWTGECPSPIRIFPLINDGFEDVTFSITLTPSHPNVQITPTQGTVPGTEPPKDQQSQPRATVMSSQQVTMTHVCEAPASFQSLLSIQSSNARYSHTTNVTLNFTVLDRVLVLDFATGPFPAGSKISLRRITGGTFAEEAACPTLHVHGVISIDGLGPFPDPRQGAGCGHGVVIEEERVEAGQGASQAVRRSAMSHWFTRNLRTTPVAPP